MPLGELRFKMDAPMARASAQIMQLAARKYLSDPLFREAAKKQGFDSPCKELFEAVPGLYRTMYNDLVCVIRGDPNLVPPPLVMGLGGMA